MTDILFVLSLIPERVWWVLGAVFCIVGIILGLNQHAKRNEPKCRGCEYNNFGECENKFLCEDGELWEAKSEYICK